MLLRVVLCERWRKALRRRPAGAGVKPPCAALAEDRRGERQGKGTLDVSGGDQEGVPEPFARRFGWTSLMTRRKLEDGIKTEVPLHLLGMSLAAAR